MGIYLKSMGGEEQQKKNNRRNNKNLLSWIAECGM